MDAGSRARETNGPETEVGQNPVVGRGRPGHKDPDYEEEEGEITDSDEELPEIPASTRINIPHDDPDKTGYKNRDGDRQVDSVPGRPDKTDSKSRQVDSKSSPRSLDRENGSVKESSAGSRRAPDVAVNPVTETKTGNEKLDSAAEQALKVSTEPLNFESDSGRTFEGCDASQTQFQLPEQQIIPEPEPDGAAELEEEVCSEEEEEVEHTETVSKDLPGTILVKTFFFGIDAPSLQLA
jgi:hypothetical protein